MALQVDFTFNDTGLVVEDAYVKITKIGCFFTDEAFMNIDVSVWASATARSSGLNPLLSLNFEKEYEEGLTRQSVYNWIKTQDGFTLAVDV